MSEVRSFRDLRVYRELKRLHLEVHAERRRFPKFETYELGAQVRRSSNSAPAILAEGWGSKHTNIYIEVVNRSMGEARETQHHLDVAREKGYLSDRRFEELDSDYEQCGRMLERLHQSLSRWRGSTRTGSASREEQSGYGDLAAAPDWETAVQITLDLMGERP